MRGRRARRSDWRRRRQLVDRNRLPDMWQQRVNEPIGPLSPIVAVSTPSPTATASERTGARLTLRMSVTALVVLGLFTTLLVRLWSLQVIDGPQLNALAKATTTRSVVLEPARGEIMSREGAVLAGSVAKEQVTIDPAKTPKAVISRLAALLGVTSAQITTAIKDDANGPFAPVPVPTGPLGVTKGDTSYIEGNPSLFLGVTVGLTYQRTYPQNALASQLIGYVSEPKPEEESGATGLEEEYNHALVGVPGGEQVEVDPEGDQVEQGAVKNPTAGDNVVTNLDVGLEQVTTNALANEVTQLRAGNVTGGAEPAPWAAAVVLQNNGAVLAAVSYPGYNNNLWVPYITTNNYKNLLDDPDRPLNDYVVSGLQPPGSTFKLATATAALDRGLISPYKYIDDDGNFVLGDKTYKDSDNEALGEVDVVSALAESSDYYFYNLGALFWEQQKQYGATPIQNTAKSYGLGVAPPIDLPSTQIASGQLDSAALRLQQHRESPKDYPYTTYFGGDNVDLAIGQGETVLSPLQMADAYEAFANDGELYAPEIAHAIVSPSGTVKRRIAPKVIGHVSLPASTYEPMLAGFRGTVQDQLGTAYGAFTGFNFSNWEVAGKTGTASTSLDDSTPPTAWFVGFGGPKNAPARYIVAVVVDEAGFGADASAPVARQIFNYLQAHGVGAVKLPATNATSTKKPS
jgi:penicillin-binding protein 2